MNSELLTTLLIVRELLDCGPCSAASLARSRQCSRATLKRRMDDARGMGVAIESVKLGASWFYHCANAATIEERLNRWIDLERARALVA